MRFADARLAGRALGGFGTGLFALLGALAAGALSAAAPSPAGAGTVDTVQAAAPASKTHTAAAVPASTAHSAAAAPTSPAHSAAVAGAPRIAIATAFAPEFDAIVPLVASPQRRRHNGATFLTGRIGELDVVVFQTGVSIVSATMTTQLAIDLFSPDEIVVSGIAGGVDPTLNIGDVIVPARWGKYDEMVFLRDSQDALTRIPPALAPRFEPFGFMGPRGVRIASDGDPAPSLRFWFEADAMLLDVAREAAASVSLAACRAPTVARRQCLTPAPRALVGGSGVSGSVFLDNAGFRRYLHATLEADIVEMETAAIAMVAKANGLRFVAFRAVSDLAGGDAGANEMETFMSLAAGNAARFLTAYLEARRKQP